MMSIKSSESLKALQVLALLTIWIKLSHCLIITSVLAGDKKFKTISFDSKFLKPLTFEKEMPSTEFRRYRILRPPKFDIDVNIPIKLPLEEEYPYEEPKKPVTSHISLQTGEITEPSYGSEKGSSSYSKNEGSYHQKQQVLHEPASHYEQPKQQKPVIYKDEAYAASQRQPQFQVLPPAGQMIGQPQQALGMLPQPLQFQQNLMNPMIPIARSDQPQQQQTTLDAQKDPLFQSASYNGGYGGMQKGYQNNYQDQGPEFVPGGFVNLQLSGPTGGPKPTYEDYDRERWSQQLSQAAGAMPYPFLNYHQIQNYYGGLGTFTNGLIDTPYAPQGLVEKLKSSLHHVTSKFHIG